jgi:hypothetical protein
MVKMTTINKRSMNNCYNFKSGLAVFLLALLWITESHAQPVSPFNQLKIQDTAVNYSFIVSGHFYGASTNASTFPASSLLANIDQLNSQQAAFLISLGDLFMDVNDDYLDHYRKSLFNKIKIPLFNAVGNHDVSNGNKYEKLFGPTYFSFRKETELFFVLNTEMDDGSIKNEQLDLLRNELQPDKLASVKNIYIFSHRPVWAEHLNKYKKLFSGNTRTTFGRNNFMEDVLPLLQSVSRKKYVCWMSGSTAGGPASFFYDKHEETNITFMQTAIRDQPWDAVLLVKIENSNVFYSGISFTGQKLNPVQSYNVKYWLGTPSAENKFNYRMIPYLTKQLLMDASFWIGFFASLVIICTLWLFGKRTKLRKRS